MQNYDATILQQYKSSPTLTQLITNVNGYVDPSTNITAFITNVFDISTAQGFGLDLLGRIVGITRIVAVAGYGTYSLSDAAYQTLLYAKCLANICNGSIPGLNAVLMTLFPGTGDNYVTITGTMTMTVHLAFTPTQVQLAILKEVFPTPVGVVVTWPSASGAGLSLVLDNGVAASGPMGSQVFAANEADASGGSGSYSYAWSIVSPTGGTWSLSTTTGDTTVLSVSGVAAGVTATATLHCVATDTISSGTTAQDASYSLDNTTVAGSFTVTIGGPQGGSGHSFSHTFNPATAQVSGGSGSFTYQWNETDDGLGSWSFTGGTTATAIAHVTSSDFTNAQISCTVTDTVSGQSVTSPSVNYHYWNRSGT